MGILSALNDPAIIVMLLLAYCAGVWRLFALIYRNRLESRDEDNGRLIKRVDSLQEDLREAKKTIKELESPEHYLNREKTIEGFQQVILRREGKIANLQTALDEAKVRIGGLEATGDETSEELLRAREEKERLQKELDLSKVQIAQLNSRSTGLLDFTAFVNRFDTELLSRFQESVKSLSKGIDTDALEKAIKNFPSTEDLQRSFDALTALKIVPPAEQIGIRDSAKLELVPAEEGSQSPAEEEEPVCIHPGLGFVHLDVDFPEAKEFHLGQKFSVEDDQPVWFVSLRSDTVGLSKGEGDNTLHYTISKDRWPDKSRPDSSENYARLLNLAWEQLRKDLDTIKKGGRPPSLSRNINVQ